MEVEGQLTPDWIDPSLGLPDIDAPEWLETTHPEATEDRSHDPPRQTWIAVEHPGQIRSIERAIQSLGGQAALRKLANDPERSSLELRFRPQNRFEHPIVSSTVKTNNLVLHIRKTHDSEGKLHIEHKAVAQVKHSLRFRDMCDFQWTTKGSPFLAKLDKSIAGRDAQNLASFSLGAEDDYRTDLLDLIPPPIFSNTVIPHAYNYMQNPASKKVQTDSGVQFVNKARGLKQHIITVTFDDAQVPLERSPKLPATNSKEVEAIVVELRALFESRPIWTKRGLQNNLSENINTYNIKYALPYVSYLWKSGPWRDCYVKFGLDPRKSSSFAQYQAIYCVQKTEKNTDAQDIKQSQSHIFDGKTLHPAGRTYMFLDMVDPILKQIQANAKKRRKVHPRDGWWYSNMITSTRIILRGKLVSLCSGQVPSDLEYADALKRATEPDDEKKHADSNIMQFDDSQPEDEEGGGEADDADDDDFETMNKQVEELISDANRAGPSIDTARQASNDTQMEIDED